MISTEVHVHAAAFYVALLRAEQLEEARSFQRWYRATLGCDFRSRPLAPTWWRDRDDLYDADELGLDPEHDDEL